jgi:tRNA nucleotidyltransferase (CCA-adding enzyme)
MIGSPFANAVPILELIEQAGFEAYFVGGSVRDHLLGREIADVDIATSALPAELKEIFPKTTDVGIEHGTILVHFKGIPYEITTFRAEAGYTDYRRPDKVSFIRSLKEDLQRRDFTMNAIAMDKDGRIHDPFQGRKAIDDKVISTVGNPDDRFSEDALRMLRAVRFLSQLNFKIEEETLESLQKHASLLEKIAVERKTVEFEKMLQGRGRNLGIVLLVESGVYQYLPGLMNYKEKLIQLSKRQSEQLALDEIWALILYELGLSGKEAEVFLREWKLPVQKIKKIKQIHLWLLYRVGDAWDKESVYHAGIEIASYSEKVYKCLFPEKSNASQIYEISGSLPISQRSELKVTGTDLMAWFGKGPGPWLREVLDTVEQAVINGVLQNETEKIREWLNECNLKSGKN